MLDFVTSAIDDSSIKISKHLLHKTGQILSKYYHRSSPNMSTEHLTTLLYLNVGQLKPLINMLINSMDEIQIATHNNFTFNDLKRVKNEILQCQAELTKQQIYETAIRSGLEQNVFLHPARDVKKIHDKTVKDRVPMF